MLEILVTVVVLLLDQITKILSEIHLTQLPFNTYTLIDGVVNLTYVQNTGASFGMMSGFRIFFIVITIAASVFMVYFLIKEHKRLHALMRISVSLILSGAVGNLIDRIFFGYVRDMIEPAFIDFAVFNIADSAITVGVILLALDVLFFKKGKAYSDELELRIKARKQERKDARNNAGKK